MSPRCFPPLVTTLLLFGCAFSAGKQAVESLADDYSPEVQEGLHRVQTATRAFANLDSAVAAGYERNVPRCFSDSVGSSGAMGYHHLNRGLVDAVVEVERPEILLYEPRGGHYALNGVEYIIPYSRWPRDSVPPTIMGETLRQSDILKLWYLHMWAWTRNRAGLFADWNPDVHCQAEWRE